MQREKLKETAGTTRYFPYFDESSYDDTHYPWPDDLQIDNLPGAVYLGPHFLGDDHGCYHGNNSHGVAAGSSACGDVYPGISRPDVVKRCLSAIERATHLFVWIDDSSAYGTLVEIGYARALGKQVHVYMQRNKKELEDLWFASQIASNYLLVNSPTDAWADFSLRLQNSVVPSNKHLQSRWP